MKEGIAIEKAYKNNVYKNINIIIFSEGGKFGKAKALPALPLPTALYLNNVHSTNNQ